MTTSVKRPIVDKLEVSEVETEVKKNCKWFNLIENRKKNPNLVEIWSKISHFRQYISPIFRQKLWQIARIFQVDTSIPPSNIEAVVKGI